MWNARHALIASRCAWCGQVWTGQDWIPERRTPGRETYANGICLTCADMHFSANQGQTRLNVEQFKMRPNQPMAGQAALVAGGEPLGAMALADAAQD